MNKKSKTLSPNFESAPFEGMSDEIFRSHCPAAWKDVFTLCLEGQGLIVPCQSTMLAELPGNKWVLKTSFGEFILNGQENWLELIMEEQRDFSVLQKTPMLV